MARLLRMPEVAANATEAVLADWSVPENVAFAAQDSLATVETEKALVDVEADQAGVVLKALVLPGSQVEVGAPIAVLGDPGEQVADLDALLADLGVSATSTAPVPERRDVPDPEGGTASTHPSAPSVEHVAAVEHAGTGSSRARWPASSPRTPASRSSRSTARDPGTASCGATSSACRPHGHDRPRPRRPRARPARPTRTSPTPASAGRPRPG